MCNPLRTLGFAALLAILASLPLGRSPALAEASEDKTLVISAIPDQDPKTLQKLYGQVAEYLSKELGVKAEFRAVPDYPTALKQFKDGKLDLVWFGGLTGVQARQQVPDAHYVAQRDIDEKFRSVFIVNQKSDIRSLEDLKGKTFTFGSQWSTSGRLMPQHFLKEKGIKLEDFKGKPHFSGDHDKTLNLVAKGTYEAGVMNEQVWKRHEGGKTEASAGVRVIHTTPAYPDYHWLLHPDAAKRLGGSDFVEKVQAAFLKLDQSPNHAQILELFGAKKFIPTKAENYKKTERIASELGLLRP